MKHSMPVTLDDLQQTAKDDKDHTTTYRGLIVTWNILGHFFTYVREGRHLTHTQAEDLLEKFK